MWWNRKDQQRGPINPYLGVGYTVPEHWTARECESLRGIQLLPPRTRSAYPAALFLDVYADKQNDGLRETISHFVSQQSATATQFVETRSMFEVHPQGFAYAAVEYRIETSGFLRRESHHLIACDFDGRVSVTASSCCTYWEHLVPIRDAFLASLVIPDAESGAKEHYFDQLRK